MIPGTQAAPPAGPPSEAVTNAARWISRALEVLWLFTVISVPLAFVNRDSFLSELELAYVDVPKTVVLRTLVGLMAILWLSEWALTHRVRFGYPFAGQGRYLRHGHQIRRLTGWIKNEPTRWITLAVVLYLTSTLLSTVFSESFNVSMWGLVPAQDTYPAYTIICYSILFGVVSTHVKNRAQVERLLWAVAFMGAIVGVYSWAQFYGHDVFNLREIPNGLKSGSTMGNSILAGAVLLMTITISLVAATINLGQPVRSRRFWGLLGLWGLILTVQITALIYSSARGPWGASISGLFVLLGLVAIFTDWRSFVRMIGVLGLAAGLSVAITIFPPPIPMGDPTTARAGGYKNAFYEIPPPAKATPLAQAVPDLASSIGRDVLGDDALSAVGGLSGRIGIWETSGQLITKRPWFEFDGASLPYLRTLLGYGPDTFKYAYLLERLPRGPDRTVASERFAHNFLIHKWVELGLLGLLTTAGLFAVPVIVSGYKLFRRRWVDSPFSRLVIVGLMAALAGRFIEQMVGIASVSDLTIFWVMLALFASTPAAYGVSCPEPLPNQTDGQECQAGEFASMPGSMRPSVQTVLTAIVVLCLISGIVALTWTKSINYLEAGFEAREGLDKINASEFQDALTSLNRAIALAPDVSVYHSLRAAVYSGYRRLDNGLREPGCAHLTEVAPYQTCLARKVYSNNLEAAAQRPLDWRLRQDLADSALNLALLDGDPALADESIRFYREVAQLDPQTWWHWELLAAAHIQTDQPGAALKPLEKSLAILDGIPRASVSRLLQGIAYSAMGEHRSALMAFDSAIGLDPKSAESYTNRGGSHNALGEYQRAIQDLDEAIDLNPALASAYNNRGNSYGNLDQLQKAIKDYDEAIRLDPRFTVAYANRALAYTYVGRDEEARIDVTMGTAFGLDPGPVLSMMEEVRNAR